MINKKKILIILKYFLYIFSIIFKFYYAISFIVIIKHFFPAFVVSKENKFRVFFQFWFSLIENTIFRKIIPLILPKKIKKFTIYTQGLHLAWILNLFLISQLVLFYDYSIYKIMKNLNNLVITNILLHYYIL